MMLELPWGGRCTTAQRHLAGVGGERARPGLYCTVRLGTVPHQSWEALDTAPVGLILYFQRVWRPSGAGGVLLPGSGEPWALQQQVAFHSSPCTSSHSCPSSVTKRPLIWKNSQVAVGKLEGTHRHPPALLPTTHTHTHPPCILQCPAL